VGIFASAVRVADLCNFLSTGIMVSVAPSLISIRSESEERYTAHIARLFQGLTIIMTLVAILLSLFGDALITLALGPAYEASAAVLRIYIWSAVFIALGVVQGQWLVNEGYEKLILIQGLAGAAVNIAANLILIPAYGAEGAAISTCIAQFTSCVLCNLFYDRRTRMIFMLQMKALVWANIHLLLPARRRPFAASEASAGDD
jgi:O-antigen/teichoic acid export membrane protein